MFFVDYSSSLLVGLGQASIGFGSRDLLPGSILCLLLLTLLNWRIVFKKNFLWASCIFQNKRVWPAVSWRCCVANLAYGPVTVVPDAGLNWAESSTEAPIAVLAANGYACPAGNIRPPPALPSGCALDAIKIKSSESHRIYEYFESSDLSVHTDRNIRAFKVYR